MASPELPKTAAPPMVSAEKAFRSQLSQAEPFLPFIPSPK
jgi:hypothetical protein